MAKKIKVCKKCSGFDVKELNSFMNAKDYSVGCLGKCSVRKCCEYDHKVFGILNGEFTICDSKEAFFEKIRQVNS